MKVSIFSFIALVSSLTALGETYSDTSTETGKRDSYTYSDVNTNTSTSKTGSSMDDEAGGAKGFSERRRNSRAEMNGGKFWLQGAIAEALYDKTEGKDLVGNQRGAKKRKKDGLYECQRSLSDIYFCYITKVDTTAAKILFGSMKDNGKSVRQLGDLKCSKDKCRFPGSDGSSDAKGESTSLSAE